MYGLAHNFKYLWERSFNESLVFDRVCFIGPYAEGADKTVFASDLLSTCGSFWVDLGGKFFGGAEVAMQMFPALA